MKVLRPALILLFWLALAPAWGQSLAITSQPVDQTVRAGDTARFEVTATGPATLGYRWRKGRTVLAGETNAFLVITNVTASSEGNYSVVVTAGRASLTSSAATLTVLTPPSITVEPPDLGFAYQTVNHLTVTAQGDAPLVYLWEHDGKPFAAEKDRVLSISFTNLGQLGDYRVIVTNAYGAATSRVARVTLHTNVVEFATNTLTVTELQGVLNLPLRRSGSTNALTLPVTIAEGNAVTNLDFRNLGLGRFSLRELTGTVFVRVLDDAVVDGPKTLTFELQTGGAPDVVLGAQTRLTLNITDNDTAEGPGFGFDGPIQAIEVDLEGRVLVAGTFESVHGVARPRLARLDSRLALDPSFAVPSLLSTSSVAAVAIAPDGKVLVRGVLSFADGVSRMIRRLNPDGSFDTTFGSFEGQSDFGDTSYLPLIRKSLVDGTGRLLLAGRINQFYLGNPRENPPLMRLNPDGSRDAEFSANIVTARVPDEGFDVAILPDGRLILGGSFTNNALFNNRGRILCLQTDGSIDPSFRSGAGFDNRTTSVAVDHQSRILVAGPFGNYDGAPAPGWVRLASDGTLDPTFSPGRPGSNVVQQIILRDGRILARHGDGTASLLSDTGDRVSLLASNTTALTVLPSGEALIATSDEPRLYRLPLDSTDGSTAEFRWETAEVSEAAEGLRLPVQRMGSAESKLTRQYRVLREAGSSPADLAETTNSISFEPGQISGEIRIRLTGQNETPNDDRGFRVEFLPDTSDPSAKSNHPACHVTIVDDDTGLSSETFVVPPPTTISPELSRQDIMDPRAFVAKLRAAADPVSLFLRGRLSPTTLDLVDHEGSANGVSITLVDLLVKDLTAIVLGPSIWDPGVFSQTTLYQQTRYLLEHGRNDRDRTALNRFLLSDTYVHEIRQILENERELVAESRGFFQQPVGRSSDPTIFAEWGWSAARGTTNDYFSVIWTGMVVPEVTGQYRFNATVDDGVRMWLGDRMILRGWRMQIATNVSEVVEMEAGVPQRLSVHYFDGGQVAISRLRWLTPGSTNFTPVPRRVLRPASPLFIPPTLAVRGGGSTAAGANGAPFISPFQIDYSTEAGRPVRIESSTNGVDWLFVAEVVSRVGGETNSFAVVPSAGLVPAGGIVRAVSIDGLAVTNLAPLPFAARVTAPTNVLLANPTNLLWLTASANGWPTQSFTWFHDGLEVASGPTPTLSLAGNNRNAAGEYRVIVQSPQGIVASEVLRIGVLAAPQIEHPLGPWDLVEGGVGFLDSGISGGGNLTFQWFHDGTALPRTNVARLWLPSIAPGDAGEYVVVARNEAGSVTNGPGLVSVRTPLSYHGLPADQLLPLEPASPLTLQPEVAGSGPIHHQWRLNGTDIHGATNRQYHVPAASLADAGRYTLASDNGLGAVISPPMEARPALPELNGADAIAEAVAISETAGGLVGNNATATHEPGEPAHAGKPGRHSLAYRWTASGSGAVTFRTLGSSFDTLLAVYSGPNPTNGTELASNDDAPSGVGFSSEVTFGVAAGAAYWIVVDGYGEAAGNFALTWEFTPSTTPVPRIVTHPASQGRPAGERVVLEVVAENAAEISWLFNGQPLPQATGGRLVFEALEPRQVGRYVAVVRSGTTAVYSHEAVVEISAQAGVHSYDKPEDFGGPGAASPGLRALARRVTGAGAGALVVSPGLPLPQIVNNAAYTTQSGEALPCGVLLHRTGWLPVRTTQDGHLAVQVVSAEAPTLVAWYDGADRVSALACSTNGWAVLGNVPANRLYWLSFGSLEDAGGLIELAIQTGNPPPEAVSPPVALTVQRSEPLQLDAPRTPGLQPPPTYTWLRDGAPIPGATGPSYEIAAADVGDAGAYSVLLENGLGIADHPIARVEVGLPLRLQPDFVGRGEGGFRLGLTGNPGQRVVVERSTTWPEWQRQEELWLELGLADLVDPGSVAEPQAIYRAREVPLTPVNDVHLTDGTQGWHVQGGRLGRRYRLLESFNQVDWVVLSTNVVARTPYLHLVFPGSAPHLQASPIAE